MEVDALDLDQRGKHPTDHGGTVHYPAADYFELLVDLSLPLKRRISAVAMYDRSRVRGNQKYGDSTVERYTHQV